MEGHEFVDEPDMAGGCKGGLGRDRDNMKSKADSQSPPFLAGGRQSPLRGFSTSRARRQALCRHMRLGAGWGSSRPASPTSIRSWCLRMGALLWAMGREGRHPGPLLEKWSTPPIDCRPCRPGRTVRRASSGRRFCLAALSRAGWAGGSQALWWTSRRARVTCSTRGGVIRPLFSLVCPGPLKCACMPEGSLDGWHEGFLRVPHRGSCSQRGFPRVGRWRGAHSAGHRSGLDGMGADLSAPALSFAMLKTLRQVIPLQCCGSW